MKPNEFGTMSSDYILAKDIPFGNYSLSLSPLNQSEYIAYGRTNFQVGTPHNSLFSTEVTLRSPDIE